MTWTNVFQFTADGNNGKYGDRIPAFYIQNQNENGYFQICSAVNGIKNYAINHKFDLGKQYQITIKQYEKMGKYIYEIIIDGDTIDQKENTKAMNFSNVKLYGSNPWIDDFTYKFGSACGFNIVGAP